MTALPQTHGFWERKHMAAGSREKKKRKMEAREWQQASKVTSTK